MAATVLAICDREKYEYTNVLSNWYIQMRLNRSEDFGCTTIHSGKHRIKFA